MGSDEATRAGYRFTRLNIYQLLLKSNVTGYIHTVGPLVPGNYVDGVSLVIGWASGAGFCPSVFSELVSEPGKYQNGRR